ncbi:MAG TPA: VOC family protein [Kofleriaceae bacterium]|nr:VOC family protein [Kofleriaceae bacterium]
MTGSIDQLGYLAFEVSDLNAWESFATNVLGLGVVDCTDGGFALRMDDHAARFFVTQGPADDLAAVGWEVADEQELDRVLATLPGAREGTAEEAAARAVVRLVIARDPAGTQVEVAYGPARAEPFVSPLVRSGFVAGAHGLGHLVVSAPEPRDTAAFYQDLLGFKLSDRIVCTFYGYPVDITFLHTNSRHHSVAFGGPQPKRLHHFLLEVGSIDDVGAALDRAIAGGVRIAQMLGRHPNDKMISFYAFTPSGFQFEYGTGGRLVDDATWQPTTHDRVSEWGHHPPERYAPRRK